MQVKGLRDALGKKGVSSNYSYEYADKTWVPHIVPGIPTHCRARCAQVY